MKNPGMAPIVMSIAFLSSCSSSESIIKDKVWAEIQKKLKAPSTAKLISFNLTPIIDPKVQLDYWLKSSSSLKAADDLFQSYAKNRFINANYISIIELYDKSISTWLISQLRSIDIKYATWLDASPDLYQLPILKDTKNNKAVELLFLECSKRISKSYQERFDKYHQYWKFYFATIDYDAQNSYGVMLRGQAISPVILTSSDSVTVIEVTMGPAL
jgi:hypothetical protein